MPVVQADLCLKGGMVIPVQPFEVCDLAQVYGMLRFCIDNIQLKPADLPGQVEFLVRMNKNLFLEMLCAVQVQLLRQFGCCSVLGEQPSQRNAGCQQKERYFINVRHTINWARKLVSRCCHPERCSQCNKWNWRY